LAAVAQRLRDGLEARGHRTMGDVICPVVPVFIGTTATGRVASELIARSGLIAHLVEQTAVVSDAARVRLQAMTDDTPEDADPVADIVDTCIHEAKEGVCA